MNFADSPVRIITAMIKDDAGKHPLDGLCDKDK